MHKIYLTHLTQMVWFIKQCNNIGSRINKVFIYLKVGSVITNAADSVS